MCLSADYSQLEKEYVNQKIRRNTVCNTKRLKTMNGPLKTLGQIDKV